MDHWAVVIEMLQGQDSPAAQGLIDLAEHVRALPAFEGVQAGLAGLALALGRAQSQRRVYVEWVRPWTYAVFLDFCEPAFYGQRVEVAIEDVVTTIEQYLEQL